MEQGGKMQSYGDFSAILRYEKLLRIMNRQGIKYANRAAVADMAFTARREAVKIVGEEFILRNKWTTSGMRVEKRSTEASMGSIRPYMERQEFGGRQKVYGIPTTVAAGQGLKAVPRRRRVLRANYLQKIRLPTRARGAKTKKQANAIAMRRAKPFAFLDLGRRKGVFRRRGNKAVMLYDMSQNRVDVPPNPWLKPAVEAVRPLSMRIYRKALYYQLRRLK